MYIHRVGLPGESRIGGEAFVISLALETWLANALPL